MRTLTLLLLLAGCAAVPPSHEDETRLARELVGRTAGEAQTCVPIVQSRSLQVVDERTLVYSTSGAVWVNRLEAACPGLNRWSTLIVEPFTGRYCRGDRVRGLEPGTTIPGPRCLLNDWVPYRRPE